MIAFADQRDLTHNAVSFGGRYVFTQMQIQIYVRITYRCVRV